MTILSYSSVFSQSERDQYYIANVGFYNLENLFDTSDDPLINDDEYLPTGSKQWTEGKYTEKINQMAEIVSQVGMADSKDGLVVLGVSEVENLKVLQDFTNHPSFSGRNYGIVHEDSKDKRGIDVALIYNKYYFKPTSHKIFSLNLGSGDDTYYSRDILLVSGQFDGELMHFIVNHWPSRSGGEVPSEKKRIKGAKLCKSIVDSLTTLDPLAKVIIMGDFNDDPTNKSVNETLSTKAKMKNMFHGDLYNPMYMFYLTGAGTLAHRNTWNVFDQIILSSGIALEDAEGYRYYKTDVYQKKEMFQSRGQYRGYPKRSFNDGGYSDHLPVYISLIKPVKN